MTDLVIKEVLEDSEEMLLEIERLGEVAQLHFQPRKWSHNWLKRYREKLARIESQLAEQGVSTLVEGMYGESEHKIRFIRMFGFKKTEYQGIVLLYKRIHRNE